MQFSISSLKKTIIYILLLLLLGSSCYIGFSIFKPCASNNEYLYIQDTDSPEAIEKAYKKELSTLQFYSLKFFFLCTQQTPKTGRYSLACNVLQLYRRLCSGRQTPIRITIPLVRTKKDLSDYLGKKLEFSANNFLDTLNDSVCCAAFRQTPSTILCLFIPNTYEVYWTITPKQLLEKMDHEANIFWNSHGRKKQLEHWNLSPTDAYILASIVAQETSNSKEKPRIAGMYLNRLKINMRLQADPTLKFAANNFSLQRISGDILKINSPYNTYLNKGLPPGPICIPDIHSLEAVIQAEHHDFLYMCANADFSGTHVFAKTFKEHQQNAQRYIQELNKMNINK